jgi:hypothetical protein
MKTLGKMSDGSVLLAMSIQEIEACETIARAISQKDAPAPQPVSVPHVALHAVRHPLQVHSREESTGDKRICLVCEKPIHGSLRGGRKVHPGACTKIWCAKSKREKKQRRNKPAPARAPEGNPADPLLTDAQRKELMDRRLKIIRDSVKKHQGD